MDRLLELLREMLLELLELLTITLGTTRYSTSNASRLLQFAIGDPYQSSDLYISTAVLMTSDGSGR